MTRAPVFDLHCDAVLKLYHKGTRLSDDNPASHVDIPKMRRGGVDGVCFSLYCDHAFNGPAAVARTHTMLDLAKKEIQRCSADLFLTTTAQDLDESLRQGKITAMLGIEGGHSIDCDLKNLERFHKAGVRRLTLTHTKSTSWAASGADAEDRGLSDFGREVVAFMNDIGMVVDLAHVSRQTLLDAAAASRKPVICSHSLARAAFDYPRLSTDEEIRAIARSGGVFGVCLLADFFPGADAQVTEKWMKEIYALLNDEPAGLSAEAAADRKMELFFDFPPPAGVAPVEGLVPHIDHVIGLIGEDHVAIGTDFDGMPFGPRGLENASRFDNLRSLLSAHGYSQERICKLLGANARRVLKEILG
jgi:membrane dipeptidase